MSGFCNASGKECRDLKTQLTLFQSRDGMVSLPVPTDGDTVWLSQAQMAELFGKDRSVVAKHIGNAIREGEVDPETTCAKFAQVAGNVTGVKKIDIYNLDVIIALWLKRVRHE